MKKALIVIVLIIIVGLVIWKVKGSPSLSNLTDTSTSTSTAETISIPSSQTVKVSDKLSEFKNDELGFSVKYPTNWEKFESPSNVVFSLNTADEKEKNTVGKLESKIDVFSASCVFPPATTIKERSTLKVKDLSLNMISMSSTVQGRNYFTRMYTLQKNSICYYFTFNSITLSPTSKGYTGADAQKVGARNILLVDTADTQFKDMVKTFSFTTPPVGEDETKVNVKK